MGSILRVEPKNFRTEKSYIERMRQWISEWANTFFLEKGWLYALAGFLLGRAIILGEVSPFATAFIAVMWFLHREKMFKSLLAVFAGALTISLWHGAFIGISIIV